MAIIIWKTRGDVKPQRYALLSRFSRHLRDKTQPDTTTFFLQAGRSC